MKYLYGEFRTKEEMQTTLSGRVVWYEKMLEKMKDVDRTIQIEKDYQMFNSSNLIGDTYRMIKAREFVKQYTKVFVKTSIKRKNLYLGDYFKDAAKMFLTMMDNFKQNIIDFSSNDGFDTAFYEDVSYGIKQILLKCKQTDEKRLDDLDKSMYA